MVCYRLGWQLGPNGSPNTRDELISRRLNEGFPEDPRQKKTGLVPFCPQTGFPRRSMVLGRLGREHVRKVKYYVFWFLRSS